MKTKIIGILIGLIGLFGTVLSADLAGFVVQTDPSTVKVGEPTDLVIEAINSNGDIIEDYEGDVIILVMDNGSELDINDYVVPNDGVYSFSEQDMGTKVFTKGLIVNKDGQFNIKVEDFETGNNGDGDIVVVGESGESAGTVDITMPQEGETLKNSTVTVAGEAQGYKNSKIQILVDGNIKSEGMVDSSGNYQVDLMNLSNGAHSIMVEVLDLDGEVISFSDEITINIDAEKELFQGINFSPSNEVNIGKEVVINVKVDTSVSSATLDIANYGEYPMDRKSTDEFTTQITTNITGKSDISVMLSNDSGEQVYDNVGELVVVEKIAIGNIKFNRDNSEKIIDLDWEFTGEIPKFKLQYGTEKGKNNQEIVVDENKYTIEDIDETKTYFIQITPVDSNRNVIGDPSKQIVIEPNMKEVATCNIDNIQTKVVVENGKHYFTWKEAEGAVKYVMFKGKDKTNLDQVAEIDGTRYELPYNPDASKTEYEYFTVKAVCDDGTMKQIDNVKKVKVGPMDWLLYAILITLIVYGLRLTIKEA